MYDFEPFIQALEKVFGYVEEVFEKIMSLVEDVFILTWERPKLNGYYINTNKQLILDKRTDKPPISGLSSLFTHKYRTKWFCYIIQLIRGWESLIYFR